MESPNIEDQQQLVDQADYRMAECFEQTTGDSIQEPKYLRFITLMILWAEEYATLRRMQGDDGIRWARDTVNYNSAKIAKLDRIDRAAARAASTTEATETTEEKP